MDLVVNLTVQILCHVGGEHLRKIMPCFRIQKGILSILESGGKPIFTCRFFMHLNGSRPASAEIQQNQASKNGWSPPDAILESVAQRLRWGPPVCLIIFRMGFTIGFPHLSVSWPKGNSSRDIYLRQNQATLNLPRKRGKHLLTMGKLRYYAFQEASLFSDSNQIQEECPAFIWFICGEVWIWNWKFIWMILNACVFSGPQISNLCPISFWSQDSDKVAVKIPVTAC